jgi:2-polyprenyl-3-methyl-5-hydroxy-6-metoxy-1,4-benzoquinol methylase
LPYVPPISSQADYWDRWNVASRADRLPAASSRQALEVEAAVAGLNRSPLRILDVGCGTGWLCERLVKFGEVTGTDMPANVIARARERLPQVSFLCGDFFELPLPVGALDVITSLEVLSHVADQPAFVRRLAEHLKQDGLLC